MQQLIAALLFVLMVGSAQAQSKKELSFAEVQQVATGLSQLNSYTRIVKDGGQEKAVSQPYRFSVGVTVMIAQDVVALRPALQASTDAHDALVRQYANGGNAVPADKAADFVKDANELLKKPSGVSLPTMKLSDLQLDTNPIEPATLVLLDPILEK